MSISIHECSSTLATLPWLLTGDLAIKSAIVLLVAWATVLVMRRGSAATRHLIWVLAVCAALTMPLLSGLVPKWRVLPAWLGAETSPAASVNAPEKVTQLPATAPPEKIDTISVRSQTPPAAASKIEETIGVDSTSAHSFAPPPPAIPSPVAATPSVADHSPDTLAQWQTRVEITWIFGAVLLAFPTVISIFSLWRMGRRLPRIEDPSWTALCADLAAALRLRRPVSLLRGRPRAMPMTWGTFRPKLVLPPEADAWSPQRRRAVLMHELAHIKRGDFAIRFMVHLARAVYWFNPLIWVASRHIAIESEGACDDLVLASETRPSDYAEHLLAIATGLKESFLLNTAAVAMARSSRLHARLVRILDAGRNRTRLTAARVCVLGLLLAAAIIPVAALRAGNEESPQAPAVITAQDGKVVVDIAGHKLIADRIEIPDKGDFRREVLKAQLEKARSVAAADGQRFNAGIIDQLTVQKSSNEVQLLEAELTGTPRKVAEVRVDAARRILELTTRQVDAGMMDAVALSAAKSDLAAAEAQLRQIVAQTRKGEVHVDALGAIAPYERVPAGQRGKERPQPVPLVFSVPEANVASIIRKVDAHQTMKVDIFDHEFKVLGHGSFTSADNQIDQKTGTLKCKAIVLPVDDAILFPNQFVNVRLYIETGEVEIPAAQGAAAHVTPEQLSGTVTDESGHPLAGVLLHVWSWCPGVQTRTDEHGRYTLKNLGSEPVEMRVSKDGFDPWYSATQPTGVELNIKLSSRTYFEGLVVSPDGKPVPDAQVRAFSVTKQTASGLDVNLWIDARSDANGRYRLYAMADSYTVLVRVPSVGSAKLPGSVIADGQIQPLDIHLSPGITFRAQIVDSETGTPIPNVTLGHWQHPGIEGTSDKDGNLVIPTMDAGKFQFNISTKGYARWWSEQATENDQKRETREGFHRNFDYLDFEIAQDMKPVRIELEREVHISGVVQDPDGNPVAGATVAPAHTGTGNSLTGDTRYSVVTNKDGSFLMALPASGDAQYNLEAHDGAYGQWRKWANGILPPIQTKPGDELKNIVIRLTKPATVSGHVQDEAGHPLVGRNVRASAADKMENRYYDPTTKTDKDGNFVLKFVRPGKQLIQAEPYFWIDVPEGERAVKLRDGNSRQVVLKEGELKTGVMLTAPGSTAFPSREEQLRRAIERMEKPAEPKKDAGADAEKIDNPAVDAPHPATQPALAYGPVVDGLQLAVQLDPDLRKIPLNQPVKIKLHFRNAGPIAIKLKNPTYWQPNSDEFLLTDANGKKVQTASMLFSGWDVGRVDDLQPGQSVAIGSNVIAFFPEGFDLSKVPQPVGNYAWVKPGKYTLKYELRAPTLGNLDTPAWQGRLATAAVPIEIVAAEDAAAKPAAPPEVARQAVQLSGNVVDDETGKPVSNFSVQEGRVDEKDPGKITWGHSLQTTTSANPTGSFSTSVNWFSNWRSRIIAGGYLSEPILLKLPDANATEVAGLVVRLKRGRRISGHVFDYTGKPVKDAGVYVVGTPSINLTGGKAMELAGGFVEDRKAVRFTTDAAGAFTVTGVGDENHCLAVTCSAIDFWVVDTWAIPVPAADAERADFRIQLPQPGKLVVHYDVPGAPEKADVFLQYHTWDLFKDSHVDNQRYAPLQQHKELILDNLAPGPYTIDRAKNPGYASARSRTLLDRQQITIESGKNVVVDFVRTIGTPVVGQIVGLDQGDVAKARPVRVEVRVLPMQEDKWSSITFDEITMEKGGKPIRSDFVTEQLSPGQYKVRVLVFVPETKEQTTSTGVDPPAFTGEAVVTVPKAGKPDLVKLELQPWKYPAPRH